MESEVVADIRGPFRKPWLALAVAASFVLLDAGACSWCPILARHRFALAAAGAAVIAWLAGFDWQALGLVLRPVQGYRYWAKAGVVIGASVLAFCVLVLAVINAAGFRFFPPALPPQEALSFGCYACLGAPIHEELLYRLVLCLPLVAVAGPRFAIVAGGATFAALHFVYGNPAPDNFIAGFFLCWAYLKSGTLLVPMVFHSVGNAFVTAVQLGIWYWTH